LPLERKRRVSIEINVLMLNDVYSKYRRMNRKEKEKKRKLHSNN